MRILILALLLTSLAVQADEAPPPAEESFKKIEALQDEIDKKVEEASKKLDRILELLK